MWRTQSWVRAKKLINIKSSESLLVSTRQFVEEIAWVSNLQDRLMTINIWHLDEKLRFKLHEICLRRFSMTIVCDGEPSCSHWRTENLENYSRSERFKLISRVTWTEWNCPNQTMEEARIHVLFFIKIWCGGWAASKFCTKCNCDVTKF